MINEEDQDRFVHLQIGSLPELLTYIEFDISSLLIMEHYHSWYT